MYNIPHISSKFLEDLNTSYDPSLTLSYYVVYVISEGHWKIHLIDNYDSLLDNAV